MLPFFKIVIKRHLLVLVYLNFLQACQGNPPPGSSAAENSSAPSKKETKKESKVSSKAATSSDQNEQDAEDSSDTASDGGMDFLSALLGGGKKSGSSGSGSGADAEKIDPAQVNYLSSRQSPYLTGKLNSATGELMDQLYHTQDPYFHCPGDSFLIGLHAGFEAEEEDRRFKAVCQFFETADKKPIKKNSCKTTSRPYNTPGLMTANFTCDEGSFLAGIYASFDESTKDRLLSFECCQMQSWNNKPVNFTSSEKGSPADMLCNERINADRAQMDREGQLAEMVNDEVNPIRQELKFECKANTMLKTISSTYMSGHYDRRYSFRCCELKVNTK